MEASIKCSVAFESQMQSGEELCILSCHIPSKVCLSILCGLSFVLGCPLIWVALQFGLSFDLGTFFHLR